MQKQIKRTVVLIIGIILIVLGLFGLVLPVLQGVIFLIVGLLLVSLCFPRVRLWMTKYSQGHKRTSLVINKMEKWLKKFIGEI